MDNSMLSNSAGPLPKSSALVSSKDESAMSEAERRAQVLTLMARVCQLGRLLNHDLDLSDMAAVAEAKLVIAEMNKAEAEIDALRLKQLGSDPS